MMAKIKWCILLSVMASCSAPKDTGTLDSCNVVATQTISHNDTLLVCDISKVNQTVTMPLSELADYKLVKLENTTKEMMVSPISPIYVSDNYVVIVGNERCDQIKLFDKSGKFIRTIGRAGNGPGEFIPAVFRVEIEEQQDRIWIADCNFERLMVYSLSTGQFVHQIPFPHKAIIPSFIVNAEDSTLLVTHVPMDQSPIVLWKQDFRGNILQQINPGRFRSEKGFFVLGSDEFYFRKSQNQITLNIMQNPAVNDSLYYYDEHMNLLRPYFAVNFSGEVPDHWIYETSDYYMVTINGSTGGDISSGFHNAPKKESLWTKRPDGVPMPMLCWMVTGTSPSPNNASTCGVTISL